MKHWTKYLEEGDPIIGPEPMAKGEYSQEELCGFIFIYHNGQSVVVHWDVGFGEYYRSLDDTEKAVEKLRINSTYGFIKPIPEPMIQKKIIPIDRIRLAAYPNEIAPTEEMIIINRTLCKLTS